MTRLSILFLVVCAGCLFEKTVGFNYYIQTAPVNPSVLSYPLISPLSAIWQPDCDKKKKGGGESSESSSSESESGEKSSKESSESKESKEGGSSESSSEEGKESKESGESKEEESKSEESSSKESGEGEKKEGSSEESGEKKKEEKKKKKYVFPPRAYDFPSNVQQIVYSPVSPYSYVPYKTSYVVQQPAYQSAYQPAYQPASYPVKSSYRYVPAPATAAFVNSYSAPIVSRLNSPVTKIVYSSGLSYPQVSKTVVSPGARVYSVQGSWKGAPSYYKK